MDQAPENQLDVLRTFAAARGWEAQEFVDRGVSGAKERRPTLDALLATAKTRKVDVVLCTKLDPSCSQHPPFGRFVGGPFLFDYPTVSRYSATTRTSPRSGTNTIGLSAVLSGRSETSRILPPASSFVTFHRLSA